MEKHGIVYTHLGRVGGQQQLSKNWRGWGVKILTILPENDQVTPDVVGLQASTTRYSTQDVVVSISWHTRCR